MYEARWADGVFSHHIQSRGNARKASSGCHGEIGKPPARHLPHGQVVCVRASAERGGATSRTQPAVCVPSLDALKLDIYAHMRILYICSSGLLFENKQC